MSWLTSL